MESLEIMSEPLLHTALINRLGSALIPVQRLAPPWRRTLGWLLLVVAIALGLLLHYGPGGMLQRWLAAPDLGWAGLGAAVTAVCAAWAAFALAVPGRCPRRCCGWGRAGWVVCAYGSRRTRRLPRCSSPPIACSSSLVCRSRFPRC